MKTNRFLAYILGAVILALCKNKINGVAESENPMSMNPSQKYDSIQYNLYLAHLDSLKFNNHRDFCYIEQTDFRDMTYRQVVNKLGEPESVLTKELEYGFVRIGTSIDSYIFGVTMYISSEGVLAENQRCYHCAKILNTPHSNIMEVTWRDNSQYVELYFLVNAHDTVAFDGFKAGSNFHWLP